MMHCIPPTRSGRRAHGNVLAIACLTLAPAVAGAQGSPPTSARLACTPRQPGHGPVFVQGNEAGTLRPSTIEFWADGSMRATAHARTAPNRAIADSVGMIAGDVRRSPLWTTVAPPITRPTRNPDIAREYVELSLSCGRRRWLYPADAMPAAFDALSRRLDALAALAGAS